MDLPFPEGLPGPDEPLHSLVHQLTDISAPSIILGALDDLAVRIMLERKVRASAARKALIRDAAKFTEGSLPPLECAEFCRRWNEQARGPLEEWVQGVEGVMKLVPALAQRYPSEMESQVFKAQVAVAIRAAHTEIVHQADLEVYAVAQAPKRGHVVLHSLSWRIVGRARDKGGPRHSQQRIPFPVGWLHILRHSRPNNGMV